MKIKLHYLPSFEIVSFSTTKQNLVLIAVSAGLSIRLYACYCVPVGLWLYTCSDIDKYQQTKC